jgi:hypothetical protein
MESHRVESGWLIVLTYRAYSLMVSVAVENDRLLAEAHYAADPKAAGGRLALAMPQCHPESAVLVHPDKFDDVLGIRRSGRTADPARKYGFVL